MSDDNKRNDVDDFFEKFEHIDENEFDFSNINKDEDEQVTASRLERSSSKKRSKDLKRKKRAASEKKTTKDKHPKRRKKQTSDSTADLAPFEESRSTTPPAATTPTPPATPIDDMDGMDIDAEVGVSAASVAGLDSTDETPDGNRKKRRMGKERKRKNKIKVKKPSKKRLVLKIILGVFVLALLAGAGLIGYIVSTTPTVDYDNIYSILAETSTLYDEEGTEIESIYLADGNRTPVDYDEMPEDLVNAFVAIEDRTFWDHHGFNFVRIIGAVKDSVFGGGDISGTSTITQQLARNLWLAETKSERSMTRKLREAYYAFQLERHLSKEQILEAYLNTISLGNNAYGVQAASQTYFSEDVQNISLVQSAQLACLPQAPSRYALVQTVALGDVMENDPNLIATGEQSAYMYNGAIESRYQLVLRFMREQEYLTSSEYSEAQNADLRASLNPAVDEGQNAAAYFVDYTIEQVAQDILEMYNLESLDEARQRVYSSGFEIHTTLNTRMQQIVEQEFTDSSNFPSVTNLDRDRAGNIVSDEGRVLLYNYSNYFDEEGMFTLTPEEYTIQENGDVVLFSDMRLNFYETTANGETDYSTEFKNIYIQEEGFFYSMEGGVINIPAQYKTLNSDGNLVIAKALFDEQPGIFVFNDYGISISNQHYTLKQRVVQPQSAMIIMDNKNGGIKAMVGGRNTEGRRLFNRTIEPRQPGSAIKPMGVYAPALQMGAEGTQISNGEKIYGKYWTAASVINDAPIKVGGRTWPRNWYRGYRGMQTMRRSIEQSVNVNAVKVLQNIGEERSAEFLKSLGVTTLVEENATNDLNAAALALGGMTNGISPLEMAAGYATFANEGTYTEPVAYSRIEKDGEVIIDNQPETEQVMDPGVAFITNDMLRTTVTDGIGSDASIGSQPVAGKTGTTTDNYDAWFVGNTPHYSASLWIGNDVNIELSEGSASAARAWSRIMRQVNDGIERGSFPAQPENVYMKSVSAPQGTATSRDSDKNTNGLMVERRSEYFIRGTEPPNASFGSDASDQQEYTVCAESGYLANPECPNPVARLFDKGSGPTSYCPLHTAEPEEPEETDEPDTPTPDPINPTNPAITTPSGVTDTTPLSYTFNGYGSDYHYGYYAAATSAITTLHENSIHGRVALSEDFLMRSFFFENLKIASHDANHSQIH